MLPVLPLLSLLGRHVRLVGIGILLFTVFSAGWWVRGLVAERGEQLRQQQQAHALAQAQLVEQEECKRRQEITRETRDALHDRLQKRDTDLAALHHRLRRATGKCDYFVPVAGAAAANDAAAGGEEFSRPAAIDAMELVDFAGDCQQNTEQLIACQQFIRKVWQANQ